jgi:hypothetical protein
MAAADDRSAPPGPPADGGRASAPEVRDPDLITYNPGGFLQRVK